MNIALIIAREGSRRLPGKNVREFCGHPLIAWSIKQALCSHLVDEVYVATDSDEIAEISEHYGAEVIRHPEWAESANRTFVFTLEYMQSKLFWEFDRGDSVTTMIPPSPLRYPYDLDGMIERYHSTGASTLAGFARVEEIFIAEAITPFVCRGVVVNKSTDPGDFMINSLGAAVRSPAFILTHDRYFSDRAAAGEETVSKALVDLWYYETKAWQAQETDTIEDFEFCEQLMEHYILKGKGMGVYDEYARSSSE